jgi:hypothetical protein
VFEVKSKEYKKEIKDVMLYKKENQMNDPGVNVMSLSCAHCPVLIVVTLLLIIHPLSLYPHLVVP